jgi:hypothetical protein
MRINIELKRNKAAALLRVLRRMLPARDFEEASEKLRVALANALGPVGGPQLLRPRDAKEGGLRMQPSRRWAICRPGHDPIEITSGELFRAEVDGELRATFMEYAHGLGYYLVDATSCAGLRAAIGSGQ